ncbi:MAG TPA: DUF5107 domain-containing protein [Planctomycetota bacterium]|nr:DUF5107 domain-containing protein [Planctomycetota bacterium]
MSELRVEPYELPAANLGPENPLPNFREEKEDFTLGVVGDLPEDEKKYIGWRAAYRVLPYRMQDGYDRVKKPRKFKACILENERIKAVVLPELGGRLWSLIDKSQGNRELLDCNKVWQPANLALRNAWFSGGIEWNTCVLGHYYHTAIPVFAARVKTPAGYDALRIYEWDRVKCFPYQIDLHLPPGSAMLYAHIRIVNPHDKEIPMYWWTNIAVPETPDTRVLVPAETTLTHSGSDPLEVLPLPLVAGKDLTYVTELANARESYFRIKPEQRKWVAALRGDGSGFIQASTARLQGRKLFCWGVRDGGRNWQDFLAVKGSRYLEIQAGLGKVQPTCIPMPANESWSWTEAFGFIAGDPKKVHSKNWNEAWTHVDTKLQEILPAAEVERRHVEFSQTCVKAPSEIIQQGSGWGALERKRVAAQKQKDKVPAELVFDGATIGKDQEPWVKLLETGVFPEIDSNAPDFGQMMTQPEWAALLEGSIKAGKSNHWQAWLHLGIAKMEAQDLAGAKAAFESSIKAKNNGWAIRNLAIIARREKNKEGACDLLLKAWEAGPKIAPLAIECCNALSQLKRFDALRSFVKALPKDIREHERIRIPAAQSALLEGKLEEVEPLFKYEFTTMREGEDTLAKIWFEYHEQRLSKKEGKPIDQALKERVRKELPPPANIDFRMIVDESFKG